MTKENNQKNLSSAHLTSGDPLLTGNDMSSFLIKIYDPDHVQREMEMLAPIVSIPSEDGFDSAQITPQGTEGTRYNELKNIVEDPRGPERSLLMVTDATLTRIDALLARAPHMHKMLTQVRRLAALALATRTPLQLPPILLVGPPGTSKTWTTWRLAEALNAECLKLNMTISTDISDLTGRSMVWRGAHTGKLARELVRGSSASPLFVLDEIDKLASSSANERPHDILHTLLEEDTARSFTDDYLSVPMRTDKVLWMFTANETTPLPPAVLDRLLIIEVPELDKDAKRHIARTIYDETNEGLNWHFDRDPGTAILDKVVESGLRQIKRTLRLAFGYSAEAKRRALLTTDIEAALAAIEPAAKAKMGF